MGALRSLQRRYRSWPGPGRRAKCWPRISSYVTVRPGNRTDEPASLSSCTPSWARRRQPTPPKTLALELERIGAQLKTADSPFVPYDDFYSVPEFSFVRFQSLDRYAGDAFQLLAEVVSKPLFEEKEFTTAKSSLVRRAEQGERSSRRALARRIASTLHPEAKDRGVRNSRLAGSGDALRDRVVCARLPRSPRFPAHGRERPLPGNAPLPARRVLRSDSASAWTRPAPGPICSSTTNGLTAPAGRAERGL